jgi:hypothetical protein
MHVRRGTEVDDLPVDARREREVSVPVDDPVWQVSTAVLEFAAWIASTSEHLPSEAPTPAAVLTVMVAPVANAG